MKQFNINKDATLPYLEIEPVMNGRNTFRKLYEALQNADISFSMKNIDTGIWKIANAQANIVNSTEQGCEDRFKIQYRWKTRDTKEAGRYLAQFKIKFLNDIVSGDTIFPKGELIVPIYEDIIVNIMDNSIKTT
jgi:hypothetical protein|nr:MAG TPA: hypothetical protein [Caudoviricetes sp.]DAW74832.1 MAG TPA: hypothetical protein [Ackermannviridae sp.]